MTTNHLILDFSHVYCDENIPKNIGIHWLDCSEIEECDLYCSRQAEEKIREKIKPYGIHGIHFLDSGNYHYVTEIMTSQIQKEFQLVVFDHHTDMQKPMIEHMTSCGDWAGKVLETNPWLQQLVLIGPQAKDIEGYNDAGADWGCSAEGQISHVLSARESSRPMGWSKTGVHKMTQLRVYTRNGGNVIDLLEYQHKKEQMQKRIKKQDELVREVKRNHRISGEETLRKEIPGLERASMTWMRDMIYGYGA